MSNMQDTDSQATNNSKKKVLEIRLRDEGWLLVVPLPYQEWQR